MILQLKVRIILVSLLMSVIICPLPAFSSNISHSVLPDDSVEYSVTQWSDSMYAAANVNELNNPADSSSENSSDSQFSWHKVLGWSTLGMMAVTISTGFIVPDGVHCGLAGITTGFAVATVADGIYEYGGLISFADGDWRYNTHAILGTLATAGFITTLALADGGAHVATGIASGVTFTIALGVIYF